MSAALFAQPDSITATHHIVGVEVTASSRNGISQLAPLHTITSESFTRLNITDMASALRHLPGVTLKDYGGTGGMKTVSVRGLGAAHTGVALDGLLLPDVRSGSIDLQQFMLAEVGAVSLSMAGNDDIFQPARNQSHGALLAIETVGAGRDMCVGSVSYGSWCRLEPSLSLRGKFGGVRYSVGGGYLRSDNDYPFTVDNGTDTHRERRANNCVRQGFVSGGVDWRLNDRTTLKALFRWADDDRQLPGAARYYTNGNDESLRDKTLLAQASLSTRLATRLWLKSSLRWCRSEQAYSAGTGNAGIRDENYKGNEAYATAALLYEPLPGLAFDYSADFFHNALTTTLAANPSPRRNTLLQSLAGKWNKGRVTASAMALLSVADSRCDLSPTVSAMWKVSGKKDVFLRLSAKRMVRLPSMTEQYYFHIGQQTLRPETTYQLNLGATLAGGTRRWTWHGTADIYINKVNDKIVCIPYNMFVWRYMNLENVVAWGADVTLNTSCRLAARHSLDLNANYSLQRVHNRSDVVDYDGLQVAYIPIHSGTATMAWTNPWANLSATVVFASATWATNEHHAATRIGGYADVSLAASHTFPLPKGALEATATMHNLTGANYCVVARYPMPGRSFVVNVKYKL